MSDNPASCAWARLSWHGRNGNYGDLGLVPPVVTIISHGLWVFFSRKGAEWLFIILWNKTGLTLIWTNCTLFSHSEHFCVCIGFACAWACTIKATLSGLIVYSSVCLILTYCMYMLAYYVCVCLLCVCLPWQGGARGPRARQGEEVGAGCLDLISQEALCAPETWASAC